MHPLASLDETELTGLARVADRLLSNRRLLNPGRRTNRRRAGFGIEFLDLREYVPGDDVRNIDWRASARSRHPQLRRYCDEASSDWFILLDCSASMAFAGGGKWSLALQCCAALAYLLMHLGNRVGIHVFSESIEHSLPLGRGQHHYGSILQFLRNIQPSRIGSGSAPGCCARSIRRNSPLFVISDFLRADAMRGDLDALALRAGRLHSIQILADADSRPPEQQGSRLQDIESGALLDVDSSPARRAEFLQAFDEWERELAQYCREKRIYFSRHRHIDAWKSVLIRHLNQSAIP